MNSNFVHLHAHSEMSLLDGINKIKDLPKIAKSRGQTAIAITDHGSVAGNYKFFKACNEEGVKPILGLEAYWAPNGATVKEKDELGKLHYHLLLIALDNTGLKNLNKLSSRAWTEGMYHKPRLDNGMLADHADGLCASSACLGSKPSQLILAGEIPRAKKLIEEYAEIFSNRFMIELEIGNYTWAGREDITEINGELYSTEQLIVNAALIEIAGDTGLPLIITNDVHYAKRSHQKLHDMALCIQTNSPVSSEKRFSFRGLDCHLASHDWMWKHCQNTAIPYEAIENTVLIAGMVDSDSYYEDRMNRLPSYTDLPKDETAWNWLEIQAKHGLMDRFNGEIPPVEYRRRLDYELHIMKKMNVSDYILIVAQIIEEANKRSIIVGPGRGSSSGSLVCWATGITQIDPIKYGLYFERFLNFGRSAIPLIFTRQMKEKLK